MKIILTIFIILISCVFPLITSADTNLDIRLQRNLENIQERLIGKDLYRKVFIYTNLHRYTQSYIDTRTLKDDERYILTQGLDRLQDTIYLLEEMITLSEGIESHNTLTLSFNKYNIFEKIQQNSENITKAKSIFIFRDSINLSRKGIQDIVKAIREININILIFIDQEWWQIVRYKDFDADYTRESLLDTPFMQLRQNKLTAEEYELFLSLFPTWNSYFPSLYQVGALYDSYDEESAKTLLEMFAYMRLKSHSELWINTYWLVTDLSRWNPSITPLGRSFSKHTKKYKLLLDAFALASRETWVFVYLKHFPWVGLGSVDSHNWVLDLRNSSEELSENIELFAYAQETFWVHPIGAMIGHVLVSDALKTRFNQIAWNFDFLITDDLGMQGYTRATNQSFANWFFSTDELSNSSKLLTLDRKSSFYIK